MTSITTSTRHATAALAVLLLSAAGCGPDPGAPPADAASPADSAVAESTPVEDAISMPGRPGRDTTFYQEAVWSPDGRRLLLSRLDMAGSYRSTIAVVDEDATSFDRLTSGPQDMWATWSPDGRTIAYASTRDGNRDIYRRTLDGRDEVRLTDDPDEDTHPAWSPDGTRIAYVTTGTADSYVVVMRSDGSDKTVVNDAPGDKWNPQWSPDGRLITYYASAEAGPDLVYVMNADGSDVRAITPGVWPGFAPDGEHLLYVHEGEVRQVARDGSEPQSLFADAVLARWAPDGRSIAFVRVTWRHPDGWPAMSQVFVSRPDGSRARRITGYD